MEILAQIDLLSILVGALPGILVGSVIVYIILKVITGTRNKALQDDLEIRIETAKKQAETIIKEARLDATEEVMKKREAFAAEVNGRENKLRQQEMALSKQQNSLDRQQDKVQQQERQLGNKERELDRQTKTYDNRNKELANVMVQQKNQLLKITSLDAEQAKEMLLTRLEDECEREMNQVIQRKVSQTEEAVEEKAKEIINLAIQRYAAEQSCEVSVSMVDIPSDDMKGRVIGREGRNIRAFEKATGVDVIVDDTPGIIVVSGFNPIRREVARLSMERLIQDGRIHPSRIEEIVNQAKKDVHSR
ncbi:MAG: ribonuclease Y, partial [Planctomycetota bacterium]